MSPTALRAQIITTLGLLDAQEDALLGLSHRCGTSLACITDAASISRIMGYGKMIGDLRLIVHALQVLEHKGLVSSAPYAGLQHIRAYTLRPERWR
jgi:hypothetical protein